MSGGSFLKIANVCSVSLAAQTNAASNLTPAHQEMEQVDGTMVNPNMLGMYLLPAAQVSGAPGSAAYITVPAEQIHKAVHQVATQQSTVTCQVPINQTQIGVPANFVFSSPVSLTGVTTNSGLQLVSTRTDVAPQSSSLSAVSGHPRGAEIGSVVDKLILQNEAILKGHDISSVRPRIRALSSHSPKPVISVSNPSIIQSQNPLVFQKLSVPPIQTQSLPIRPVVKNVAVPTEPDVLLKRALSAARTSQLTDAITRPQSPTTMCSLHPRDEPLFLSSLVEIRVKNDQQAQQGGQTRDMVCGLVCRAKVKVSEKSALSLEADLFWCNFCPFKCETKLDFLHHVMSHRFSCRICTYQAFSRADVVRHCVKKHSIFDAEPWSFCSLLNDHLKLAVQNRQKNSREKTEPKDGEGVSQELKESNREEIHQNLSDRVDASGVTKPEAPGSQDNTHALEEEQWGLGSMKSWNCRHCDFVSQDCKLIQIHCTIMHPMMNKSAKAVTVSNGLAQQIRKLDMVRRFHLEKGEKEFLKSTDSASSSYKPSIAREEEKVEGERQEQEMEMDSKDNVEEEQAEPKDIPIYECFNCHGQSLNLEEVHKHLSKEHVGQVFVAIDLLAVRRKQARYIVFCPKPGCSFVSRSHQGFSEHVTSNSCTEKNYLKLNSGTQESLSKTMLFAQNSMKTIIRSKAGPSSKVRRMVCNQKNCRYQCTTPVRMRKHMISFHSNQKPFYTVTVRHGRRLSKSSVYFCPMCSVVYCNSGQKLCRHLLDRHKIWNPSTNRNSYTIRELLMHGKGARGDVCDKKAQNRRTEEEEEDTKVDSKKMEDMMEKYLEDETQKKMACSGSGLRHAAVKAEFKLKAKHQCPRCYKCKFCKYQCLGVNLMREHIHRDHHGVSMITTDVGTRRNRQGGRVYLCPQTGCDFATKDDYEWTLHCDVKHGLQDLPIPKDVSELDHRLFSKCPPTYECLYCEGSVIRDTPALMRLHLIKFHQGEVVVMRDVLARKQCKESRFYMCNKISCDFITKHQTDYEAHITSCNHVSNARIAASNDERTVYEGHTVSEITDNGMSSKEAEEEVDDGMAEETDVAIKEEEEEDDLLEETDVAIKEEEEDDLAEEAMGESASHQKDMTEVIVQDTTTKDVIWIKVENPDF